MRKNQEQLISLKFILFLLGIFIILVLYISQPNEMKKLSQNKSFEELLEYSSHNKPVIMVEEPKETQTLVSSNDIVNKKYSSKDFEIEDNNIKLVKTAKVKPDKAELNKLLDNLAEYPIEDKERINAALNKLLDFYGYPENLIKIVYSEKESEKGYHNNYQLLCFDYKKGRIVVDSELSEKVNTKKQIAVLAQELNFFDKLAKICKSTGADTFESIFTENGITNINTEFWKEASSYADINNFNAQLYTNALRDLLSINKKEMISFYSDFEKLADNIKNPIEISSFETYKNIAQYYKIPVDDSQMKEIVKKFNEIDTEIKNLVSSTKGIEQQKVTIFDYYYSQAIINEIPELNNIYNSSLKMKNGDLTEFWQGYEKYLDDFHTKGILNKKSFTKISSLLDKTKSEAENSITREEILLAYKLKINTLIPNLIYESSEKYLRKTIVDYLKYLKQEDIKTDTQEELKCIIILLCIENNLYKSNTAEKLSLYYLNFPREINSLYNITKNMNKYMFIYNNPAFKSQKAEGITDENLLIKLINENRLDIKVK